MYGRYHLLKSVHIASVMNVEFWWNDIDGEIPTNVEEHLFQCHFVRHKSYTVPPGVKPKLTTCEGRNLFGFLNFSENQSHLTPSTVYLRIQLLTDILIALSDF